MKDCEGLPFWPVHWGVTAALLACLAVYLSGTAPWLVMDGPNPDDWRQMAGAPAGGMPLNWTTEEGRWAMDLIFVYLFGERFLTPLQVALAFPCFFWIAHCLAGRAAPHDLEAPATVLIFAFGLNHIYMVDALNFSSHVFPYPLALVLSLTAFSLMEFERGLWWRLPLAAQMLAISAGIYQPFAIFGIVLPLLALMRTDRYSVGVALRFILFGILAGVLGLFLYFLEWQVLVSIDPHTAEVNRIGSMGSRELIAKLPALPNLWQSMHTGGLQNVPFALRLVHLALVATIALGVGFAMVNTMQRSRTTLAMTMARIGVAPVAILFVVPTLIWFTYPSTWMPGRVVGYLGFFVSGVAVCVLALLPTRVRLFGFIALAGTASIYLFVASAAWHDQVRTGDLDRELARAILARVSGMQGYDGQPIRLIGEVPSPNSWGGLLGWRVFHEGNPVPGIFREMYGFGWDAESLLVSPRPCPAFPAYDAVFMHQGRAHVCLSKVE
ncbi:MAG: glucosyltransferase domain-containing protein [Paracoccaceae bacterium]|nr:glucosyltransferase domain-containing protein [Paracoccaceae bacterium]